MLDLQSYLRNVLCHIAIACQSYSLFMGLFFNYLILLKIKRNQKPLSGYQQRMLAQNVDFRHNRSIFANLNNGEQDYVKP